MTDAELDELTFYPRQAGALQAQLENALGALNVARTALERSARAADIRRIGRRRGMKKKETALGEMATILAAKGHLVGYAEIEAMYNAATGGAPASFLSEAQMHRALILLDARNQVRSLLAAAEEEYRPDSYEQQRILSLAVGDRVEAGMDHSADLDLDIVTGRKLIATLADLIEAELLALGAK